MPAPAIPKDVGDENAANAAVCVRTRLKGHMALHPVEEATVRAFVVPAKRDRLMALLGARKRRRDGLDALNHFADWDARWVRHLDPVADILACLRKAGAPSECHLISNATELDGRDVPLDEALDACESSSFASVLCCVPGQLAFFFDEAATPRRRVILSRPSSAI